MRILRECACALSSGRGGESHLAHRARLPSPHHCRRLHRRQVVVLRLLHGWAACECTGQALKRAAPTTSTVWRSGGFIHSMFGWSFGGWSLCCYRYSAGERPGSLRTGPTAHCGARLASCHGTATKARKNVSWAPAHIRYAARAGPRPEMWHVADVRGLVDSSSRLTIPLAPGGSGTQRRSSPPCRGRSAKRRMRRSRSRRS